MKLFILIAVLFLSNTVIAQIVSIELTGDTSYSSKFAFFHKTNNEELMGIEPNIYIGLFQDKTGLYLLPELNFYDHRNYDVGFFDTVRTLGNERVFILSIIYTDNSKDELTYTAGNIIPFHCIKLNSSVKADILSKSIKQFKVKYKNDNYTLTIPAQQQSSLVKLGNGFFDGIKNKIYQSRYN